MCGEDVEEDAQTTLTRSTLRRITWGLLSFWVQPECKCDLNLIPLVST